MAREGLLELEQLQTAGYSADEITAWAVNRRKQLGEAGFRDDEINGYFGTPNFDPTPIHDYTNKNLKAYTESNGAEGKPKLVEDFVEALEAGWQVSVTGLLTGGKPNKVLSEQAPRLSQIAASTASLAGDLPAMMGGAMVGGGATPAGVAGAFALPAGLRRILIDKYEKGEVASFADFWDRASGAIVDTAKGWITGRATAFVGGKVAAGLEPIVSPTVKAAATMGSEIATMVTVGSALEGHIPDPDEFLNAALVLGGAKASVRIAGKLRHLYAERGVRPVDVVQDVQQDPTIAADLLSENVEVPKAYREKIDEDIPRSKIYGPSLLQTLRKKGGVQDRGGELAHLNVDEQRKPFERNLIKDEGMSLDVAARVAHDLGYIEDAEPNTLLNAIREETSGAPRYSEQFKNAGLEAEQFAREAARREPVETPPEAPVTPPVVEPAPEPGSVAEAQANILARIKPGETKGHRFQTASELYTDVIDNLNPIRAIEKQAAGAGDGLPVSKSPYALERLTRGVAGKGTQFVKYGAFDAETYQTVGKGYTAILKPVEHDLDGFRAYMVARRVVERVGKGFETGFDLEQAKLTVRAGKDKYEKVFQEREKYRDHLLNYLREAGILDDEAWTAIHEASKAYVPFYRFFEEPKGKGSGSKVGNPLKEMTGGEQPIIDPLESDIKDTFLFLSLAEKNMARQALVAMGPEYAQKLPAPVRPVEITEGEVKEFFKAEGIEADPKGFEVFRAGRITPGPDEIIVYEQGKANVYKVDPAVAEAFNAVDRESAGLLQTLINAPGVLLRGGTVLNLDFMARNPIRDAIMAFVFAGSHPIKTAKGAYSLYTKDHAFQNWLKGGGANATIVSMDRNYMNAELMKLDRETGLMQKAWNVAKTPFHVLQIASEVIENSTRLGAVRDQLMDAKTKAQIQALDLIAREATVDFSKHGRHPTLQSWTKMTAFMNPWLQGVDRMWQGFHDDPKGATFKTLAAITLPSVLLWWKNHDDPRWEDIPRWEKDLFWIVMTDNWVPVSDGYSGPLDERMTKTINGRVHINEGTIYRVPKPFELGVAFGSVPERMLEAFLTDNPKASAEIDETLIRAFTGNFIPTFAQPLVEQFSKRSMFTGNPLVPSHLTGVLPEYQYTEYTTETAKALGKLMGAIPGMTQQALQDEDTGVGATARALTTPILIENYVRSWTGGLGMYMLQLTDAGLRKSGVVPDPVKPAKTLSDIPFVKAFVVRHPSASAQSIQDFYDGYYDKKVIFDTYMALLQEGNVDEANKVLAMDQSSLVQLTDLREALTQHSSLIRNVYKDPQMTPDEKRQLIDGYYYNMIQLAHYGNAILKDVEDAVKR